MRADRLLALMLLLQRRGKMTTQALSEALGVSRRTILRDIDALSLAGVPLYTEGGHGGGVALDENYRLSLTGLKEAEVRALFVANNSRLLRDVGLGEAAESTQQKLFAALPALHQQATEHIRQRIYIDPLWWWHEDHPLPFWEDIQRAVFEDRCIRVVYEHYDGEVVERDLEPYGLAAKASLWYLVAMRNGEVRTYRVSRLHNLKVLDSHFRRRDDFDLVAYWTTHAQEFAAMLTQYTFTLRIDSRRAPVARWYSPGRSEIVQPPGDDGWLTARFSVESVDLARMFVIGLSPQAFVVEPVDLRDSIVEFARQVLAQYQFAAALP